MKEQKTENNVIQLFEKLPQANKTRMVCSELLREIGRALWDLGENELAGIIDSLVPVVLKGTKK